MRKKTLDYGKHVERWQKLTTFNCNSKKSRKRHTSREREKETSRERERIKKADRNVEKRKIESDKKEQSIECESYSHMLKHPLFRVVTGVTSAAAAAERSKDTPRMQRIDREMTENERSCKRHPKTILKSFII